MSSVGTWKWAWAVVVAITAVVALVSVVLIMTNSALEPLRSSLATFWVSFFVGMAGAGVYLSLLLITEKGLAILQNNVIQDMPLMILLYVMSGGFVAAVIQTSSGILATSGLQSVFMIGFGWQGALSGVAATGTVAKVTEDYNRVLDMARENVSTVVAASERKINELREELRSAKEGEGT